MNEAPEIGEASTLGFFLGLLVIALLAYLTWRVVRLLQDAVEEDGSPGIESRWGGFGGGLGGWRATPALTYLTAVIALTGALAYVAIEAIKLAPTDESLRAEFPPSRPDVPTGLSATPASRDRVIVSWEDGAGETSYELERGTDGSRWPALVRTTADITENADTILVPNTTYHYRVRACNDVGCSHWSPGIQVSTAAPPGAGGPGPAEAADSPAADSGEPQGPGR